MKIKATRCHLPLKKKKKLWMKWWKTFKNSCAAYKPIMSLRWRRKVVAHLTAPWKMCWFLNNYDYLKLVCSCVLLLQIYLAKTQKYVVVTIVPLLLLTLFGKRGIFTHSPWSWIFCFLSFFHYYVKLKELCSLVLFQVK